MSERDAEMYRILGAMIAQRREAANLTQQEVADLLGWPLKRIERLEKGQRPLNIDPLMELCRAIGCSAYKLMTEWAAVIR